MQELEAELSQAGELSIGEIHLEGSVKDRNQFDVIRFYTVQIVGQSSYVHKVAHVSCEVRYARDVSTCLAPSVLDCPLKEATMVCTIFELR